MVTHGDWFDGGFWSSAYRGITAVDQYLKLNITGLYPNQLSQQAIADIIYDSAFGNNSYNHIGVTVSSDTVANAVRNVSSHVPVIAYNAGIELAASSSVLGIETFVGQPEYEAGLKAGKIFLEKGCKSVLGLMHEPNQLNSKSRFKGFRTGFVMENSSNVFSELFVDLKQMSSVEAKIKNALDTLTPSVDCIIFQNTALTASVYSELQSRNKTGVIYFAGWDLSPLTVEMLEKGYQLFAIDQQEFVQVYIPPLLFLSKYYSYTKVTSPILFSGPAFVTPETIQLKKCQIDATLPNCDSFFTNRTLNVIFLTHGALGNDPFWTDAYNGANFAAKIFNLTLSTLSETDRKGYDLKKVDAVLESLIDEPGQKDAIVLSLPNTAEFSKSLAKAKAKNITIISYGAGYLQSQNFGSSIHVGANEREVGEKAGKNFILLGAKNTVVINHEYGNKDLEERINAFTLAVIEGGGKIKENKEGKLNFFEMSSSVLDYTAIQIQKLLEEDSSIDSIIYFNPSIAKAITMALKNVPRKNFIVGGVGLSKFVLEAIKSGSIAFTFDEQGFLQSYLALSLIRLQKQYGYELQNDLISTGPTLINLSNVEKFISDCRGDTSIINGEECLACPVDGCGSGVCMDDGSCVCNHGWSGETCSILLETDPIYVKYSTGPIVLMSIAAFGNLLCFVFIVFFYVKREAPPIKSSSPIFIVLMLIGSMLIFSTIFLEVGIPTVETCTLEMWFFAIGIGLLLGNLLAKTYRIHKIFNRTLSTTAVRGIKNTFVLAFSGCILIIEVIITGILTILDPPHKFLLDNGKGNRIFICLPRSGSALPAIIVLIIFNGSLMLFATYLAIRVRGVATAYNESKHILISVYNLNFAVIILLVLVFTSSSVIGVEPKFFLNSIVILITNLSIILNLFVPKIISVYQKTDQTKTQFSSSKSNEPNNLSGIVSSTVKGSSYNKSAADFTNIQAVWTKGSVVSNITAEWEIMNFSFIVLKERNFLWVQSQNSNSIAKSFMLDLNLTTGIRKKDGTPVLIIREKKSNSELKIRFNSQQEYDIFVDLLPPEVYHKSTAV